VDAHVLASVVVVFMHVFRCILMKT